MKEKISDYTLKSNKASFSLDYNRNSKDILDIITSGLISFSALAFTSFMGFYLFDKEFSGFDIFISIILCVGSFGWLMSFLSKITQPTNNIISYDDDIKKITIRDSYLKKTIINYSEINKLEYELHSDLIQSDTNQMKESYWLELYLITKKQDKITLCIINNKEVIDTTDDIIRKKILNRAKPLINRISELLNVEPRYNKNIENKK